MYKRDYGTGKEKQAASRALQVLPRQGPASGADRRGTRGSRLCHGLTKYRMRPRSFFASNSLGWGWFAPEPADRAAVGLL